LKITTLERTVKSYSFTSQLLVGFWKQWLVALYLAVQAARCDPKWIFFFSGMHH